MKFILIIFLTFYTLNANSNCENKLFTFDINAGSDVRTIDIIENMAYECQFSVKIKDNEAERIIKENLYIVHVKDYTLENIFDFLLTQNNMFFKYDELNKVLTISYLETRSFVIDYVNLSEHTTESIKTISVGASSTSGDDDSGSSGGNSDNTTVTTKSKFSFWDTLNNEIDTILSRDGDKMKIKSKSIINRETGVVTITGTKNQISRISNYLIKIKDRLHKQVMLETKLFELTYTNKDSKGIDWTKFDLSIAGDLGRSWDNVLKQGISTQNATYNLSMNGLMDFLSQHGNVNVLSTPKILTLNNQPAVINVGQQINYRYQDGTFSTSDTTTSASSTYTMESVFIGLTLNIVPEITDDGFIILRINPVVSEQIDAEDSVDASGVRNMPPDIRIKQLSSIIKAKDGNRVVVGGLISTTDENTINKVDGLGDIPILGWAFKNKTKTKSKKELIIVITPKIISNDNFPSIDKIEKILNGTLDE